MDLIDSFILETMTMTKTSALSIDYKTSRHAFSIDMLDIFIVGMVWLRADEIMVIRFGVCNQGINPEDCNLLPLPTTTS